jgi:threonylcarbamoyladenosine tRNA methylthiotransferase MtaB
VPTVALTTLGCKLNAAETLTIGKQFIDRGYRVVEFGEQADVCVINTCSVTGRADRECRQLIRRARRSAPGGVVVVTGCYVQLNPEQVASMGEVDYLLGTREKFSLFAHVESLERRAVPLVAVGDISDADDFGPAFSTEAGSRTRAFLKVQDGCDYTCSFCTIPMARGASRSQGVEASVEQARRLVESGYREIVLTGVNVGDYGRKTGSSLARLLRELGRVDGLDRIRISSIEPNLLTDEIIDTIGSEAKLCHHVHVPLQSGSDPILAAMRRRYTAAFYRRRIESAREALPDCGIGVDVIVGFPGETDELFAETKRFLADLPVTYLHVFTYSERPKTPAATRDHQVHHALRQQRNTALRMLSERKRREFHASLVGRVMPVLLESADERGIRRGWTGNYAAVAVNAGGTLPNAILPVKITAVGDEECIGEPAGEEAA